MFGRMIAVAAAALLFAPLTPTPAAAQVDVAREWVQRCESQRGDRARHCEVRDVTLPGLGRLNVAGSNGSITVEAWDDDQVLVVAMISAQARTREDARELASQVRVRAERDRVRAEGPRTSGRQSWSTSFHVYVPMRTALELETSNGGVRVADVHARLNLRTSNGQIEVARTSGDTEARTTNGRIRLEDVAGEIRARTTNGAIEVRLNGQRWSGTGLDLGTTNGSITLRAPRNFGAELDAATTNGSIHTDFPITVQGRIGRSVRAPLGGGGPPVRLRTTNGSIRLTQL